MHDLGPRNVFSFVWFGLLTVFTDFFLIIVTADLICICINYNFKVGKNPLKTRGQKIKAMSEISAQEIQHPSYIH